MPLGTLSELKGGELDHPVLLRRISYVDAFVYRKAGDLAQLVIHMGAYRTDTIRTEGEPLRLPSVRIPEFLLAGHDPTALPLWPWSAPRSQASRAGRTCSSCRPPLRAG